MILQFHYLVDCSLTDSLSLYGSWSHLRARSSAFWWIWTGQNSIVLVREWPRWDFGGKTSALWFWVTRMYDGSCHTTILISRKNQSLSFYCQHRSHQVDWLLAYFLFSSEDHLPEWNTSFLWAFNSIVNFCRVLTSSRWFYYIILRWLIKGRLDEK